MGLLTLKGREFGQGLQGGRTQRTSYPGTLARHNGQCCAIPLWEVPGVVSPKQQAAVPGAGAENSSLWEDGRVLWVAGGEGCTTV